MLVTYLPDSLQPHRLYSPWNCPGHNPGVGSLSLLQGIFPTQGLNPDLLQFRRPRFNPGLGRSAVEGKGYPLQCSGLDNSMDCIVYGVTKSRTRLGDFQFHLKILAHWGFPDSSADKESTCQCRRPGFNPWVRKIPWRRAWQATPVLLPGESQGQRNLAGYSS